MVAVMQVTGPITAVTAELEAIRKGLQAFVNSDRENKLLVSRLNSFQTLLGDLAAKSGCKGNTVSHEALQALEMLRQGLSKAAADLKLTIAPAGVPPSPAPVPAKSSVWHRLRNWICTTPYRAAFGSPLPGKLKHWTGEVKRLMEAAVAAQAFDSQHNTAAAFSLPPFYTRLNSVFEELVTELCNPNREKVVLLTGMFGMGKTSLALDVCAAINNDLEFPGGVYTLRFGQDFADGKAKIAEEQKALLAYMGHKDKVANIQGLGGAQVEIASVLSDQLRGRRCLIHLDDVWDPCIVDAFRIPAHSGKLLVTSRSKLWADATIVQLRPEDVRQNSWDREIFGKHVARRKDTHGCFPPGCEDCANKFLERCAGDVLAIAVLGSSLADKQTVVEWEQALVDFSAYASDARTGDAYKDTLFGAFEGSWKGLSADQQQALTAAAVFKAGEPLPAPLVELSWRVLRGEPQATGLRAYMQGVVRANLAQEQNGHYILHAMVEEYFSAKPADPTAPNTSAAHPDFERRARGDVLSCTAGPELLAAFLLSYGSSSRARNLPKIAEAYLGLQDLIAESGHLYVAQAARKIGSHSVGHVLARMLSGRGETKRQLNDLTGAIVDLDRAAKLDPHAYHPLAQRGATKARLGDLQGALEDLSRALVLAPNSAFALMWRGAALRQLRDFPGGLSALTDLDRALELHPHSAFALLERGAVKQQLGDLLGALADLDLALELEPNSAFALTERGAAKRRLGDFPGALADLDRALELQPNSAFAFMERGEVKQQLGDLLGALADLDRALELEPNSAFALAERGAAKRRLSDLPGALADLDRALELRPDSAFALVQRGAAKRQLRELQGALADLDRALELHPNAVFPLIVRGAAKRQLGDLQGALADLDRALELSPGDSVFTLCNRGSVKGLLGDYAGAIADLSAAVEKEPDSAFDWQELGIARSRQTPPDMQGALDVLNRSDELGPNDYEVLKHRAYVRHLLGDAAGASADAVAAAKVATPATTVTCLGQTSVSFLDVHMA